MAGVIVVVGGALGVALGAWLGKLMTANYVAFFRFPVLYFKMSPALPLFAVAQARARKRLVQVSKRNGVEALVESGLVSGDQVIVYPSDAVQDGVRIAPR